MATLCHIKQDKSLKRDQLNINYYKFELSLFIFKNPLSVGEVVAAVQVISSVPSLVGSPPPGSATMERVTHAHHRTVSLGGSGEHGASTRRANRASAVNTDHISGWIPSGFTADEPTESTSTRASISTSSSRENINMCLRMCNGSIAYSCI